MLSVLCVLGCADSSAFIFKKSSLETIGVCFPWIISPGSILVINIFVKSW